MRGKGEGSISRSPDGSGWIARIELPRVNGQRRRKKLRAKTRVEALKLLRQMQDELHTTGGNSDHRRLVCDAVETYLELRRRDTKTSGAFEDIEWAAGVISKELGGFRLIDLTVLDCDRLFEKRKEGRNGGQPMSRGRLTRVRRTLIRVLANEVRVGRLSANVADLSVLPAARQDETERRALEPNELASMLEAARHARRIIVDLCGRNGLRPAEARALRWADLDLDAYELHVRGQQDRGNNRTSVKRAYNAARIIRLDRTTVSTLKEWREDQDKMRSKAGVAWTEYDLVASTSVGTAIDRHSLARSIRSLCKKTKVDPPITPYELRHTAISHQADAGRSAWEIADWAGTSEAMISRVYRHKFRRVADLTPVEHEDDDGQEDEQPGAKWDAT